MGNNHSQNQNQQKQKSKVLQLFQSKKIILFTKLSQKSLSLISSFLTIQEFNNLLLVSRTTYQLFSQVSGCYQIECQRLLNIKCDLQMSQNWKMIIQSLVCIPIKRLPYAEAIKSIRHDLNQFPIYMEQNITYSLFQKGILYYENILGTFNKITNSNDFQEAKIFSLINTDLLLKLRQGEEICLQLPDLLMQIYNLHDYIKIYTFYLEIRFQKCTLQQFIELWKHFNGWICTLEDATINLIKQFNEIIDESLPQFTLPKYTIRHFMISQWINKANKGQVIVNLREQFRLILIESREKLIKSIVLKEYIQYLIDISTHQDNIYQYGYYNFQYCPELMRIIQLTVDLTIKSKPEYIQDEQILLFIFGQQLYNFHLFELLSFFRIEQFKQEIKQHQSDSQIISKINIPKQIDDINSSQSNSFSSDVINFKFQLQCHYNTTIKIRQFFKQLMEDNVEITSKNEKNQCNPESLGSSGISQAMTNCSSIISSIKQHDQLYNFIKYHEPELYQKIQHYYSLEEELYQLSQENEPQKEKEYDIPELCEYDNIPYNQLMQLIQNRSKRSQVIFQQERRQTILNSAFGFSSIYTSQLTTAQQMLQNLNR